MVKAIAFCLVFVWCGTSYAGEDAVARFKNYLPREIMGIPEKERASSVPVMYLGAANFALSPMGDIVAQGNLNALMYNGLADYDGAKRAFQADLGEPVTGELTVWQIHTLNYRASRRNLTYVSFFPNDFQGTLYDDRAYIKGTVKILDEKIAYPINRVSIECYRSEGYCQYKQVILSLPDENSFSQSYAVYEIANESYRITRWENSQISATPYNNTACRINELSFNFITKEYFEIARNNSAGDCQTALGFSVPKLEKPRVSQIVDGNDIIDAEFKRINKESYDFLSSDYRKRVEATAAKNAAKGPRL